MLVMEQLPSIRQWAESRLKCKFGDCVTMADYDEEGKISVVVVLHNFRETSCELGIVSESPKWGNRRFIREVFNFCFNYAKLKRITCLIATDNEKSISVCERLGFTREGKLRQAADNGSDMWIYGMLATECRWVNYERR